MFVQRGSSRSRVAVAGALSVGLVFGLSACGDSSETDSGTTGSSAAAIDCTPYTAFGDIKGKTVTIYTGIVTPEDAPHKESYKPFEQCTGATIKYEGDKAFETQVLIRAEAGNPPDLAFVPQPGLLQRLVATGKAKEAPAETAANVDKHFGKDWKAYGTVDGKFYAAPLGANVKSLVWYSPKEFKDSGYAVPTTLAELKTLSDKMVADGKKPWCAGIASGEATGWPLTDWMEDFFLRLSGPEAYDKWVKHEIPFNGPEATAALDAVGAYLKNDAYVNGGLGDVKSIAGTTFQDAGLPILDDQCSLHRQASFYAANFPKGKTVAEDGDVFAFYLPGETADSKPVLGGGEFVVAFADRPEVKAFQTYLSSDTWANAKAKLSSGWVSANKGLDPNNLTNPVDKLSAEILLDPNATFRFDGSDMMPAAVGSNAFWKQTTNWITGQDTKKTLDNIESAWPK
ncbi:ABC transporter substrate-binding protein [Actinoplanes derwentensis]|uniref:Carbohydrate ABC transporter substrate-binding protein, CUT1 family n=1 Tax=Actinoplanes derwentensis TaxID=113562 RepID=A0A1H2A4V2_9ACTN|nr:ABC transporter substrate-binding protein [Actinoplanes derwentensis]GID83374.1 alpha-glucoside ABC transporter substrate-binding protein [Actinoplanes derwentensis]SDT41031.1 carbohydrate ABC transporter substrate-binding protein, CUT1 family [Actinoplanes derwentensis]